MKKCRSYFESLQKDLHCSLVSQPLASQHGVDSLAELMRYLELDIYKGLWRQANRKFADANTHTGPGRSQPGILVMCTKMTSFTVCC